MRLLKTKGEVEVSPNLACKEWASFAVRNRARPKALSAQTLYPPKGKFSWNAKLEDGSVTAHLGPFDLSLDLAWPQEATSALN